MKQEMNPAPTVRSARPHPGARTPAKQLYVRRTVRVFKSSAANTQVPVTVGDVVGGLVAGTVSANFKVLGFSVWNYTTLSSNSNYVKVSPSGALFEDTDTVCEGEDVGNGSSLPATRVNVPNLAAATLVGTPSSTVVLMNLLGSPTTNSAVQNYCVDVHLLVQVQ